MELLHCEKWWKGPEFLRLLEDDWPARKIQHKHTGYDELKRPFRSQKECLISENRTEIRPEPVFVSVTNTDVEFPLFELVKTEKSYCMGESLYRQLW